MSQPIACRVALRGAQFALAAAGIFFLLFLLSKQAHAATSDQPPGVSSVVSTLTGSTPAAGQTPAASTPTPVPTSTSSAISPVTSAVGSVVSSVTQPVTQ